MKLATIIIPHHNRHDHLHNLLNNIDNSLFDIVIVSGGSFGENCNRAASIAKTDNLIFANDDISITSAQLTYIANTLTCCDFVGSTQITKNKIKYYGIGFDYSLEGFPFDDRENMYHPIIALEPNKSLFPSGFFFGIKKTAWEKVGGFDLDFKTGYEDVDFGIKCVDADMTIAILDLEIFHHESESEGRLKYCKENIEVFHKKYDQKKLKQLYENTLYCI